MHTIGLLDNRIVLNNDNARPVYQANSDNKVFTMLSRLAKLEAIYLDDLTIVSRMEYYTLLELIEEIEEIEFRKQLQELIKPLVLHPATINAR